MDTRLTGPAMALRIAIGLTATLAGLDKFTNLLADWETYVAPAAAQLLPVSPGLFMKAVGVVELAVGATILGIRPALGAYAASGWLVLVAVNLAIGGHLDIAVRDLVMSVAAFTLARMTELQTATITASPHWTVSASGSSVKGAYHRDHLSA